MILPRNKSLTLLELLIALALFSLIILAFSSIQIFSHFHLLTSDRQVQLQNEVSLALEHMGKFVSQGVGPSSLQVFANGFSVRIDRQPLPTPENLTDDNWITYTLAGNTLTCSCALISGSSAPCFNNEILSTHIISNVVSGAMPQGSIFNGGFYIDSPNSVQIEIGLVARFFPAESSSSLNNPQVAMKSSFYTKSSAAR